MKWGFKWRCSIASIFLQGEDFSLGNSSINEILRKFLGFLTVLVLLSDHWASLAKNLIPVVHMRKLRHKEDK